MICIWLMCGTKLSYYLLNVVSVASQQEVFDKDVFQNDFMGQLTLTTDQIRESAKVSVKGMGEGVKLCVGEGRDLRVG